MKLNSCDAVSGELEVAESLVAHFEQSVELVVSRKTITQTRPQPLEMINRVFSWHWYGEGLRFFSYLFHIFFMIWDDFIINGVGGEVAHGYYYLYDVQQLEALSRKLRAFSNHLQTRLVSATAGPIEEVRTVVAHQIEHVLRTAVYGGIENATMFDYFFVDERLRRWSMVGECAGVVSPFLIFSFVWVVFALDSVQCVGNVLHQELVWCLVLEWADVLYFIFNLMVSARRTLKVRCLADVADRDQIEQFLEHVEGFEPLDILWAVLVVGASSAIGEVTLCQAFWRATFDQHLVEVNHYIILVFNGRLWRVYLRLQRWV